MKSDLPCVCTSMLDSAYKEEGFISTMPVILNNMNSVVFHYFIFFKSLFNGNEITVTLAIRQLYFERTRVGKGAGFKVFHLTTTKNVEKLTYSTCKQHFKNSSMITSFQ